MATLQLYNNGITAGKAGSNNNDKFNDPDYFIEFVNKTGEVPKLAKRGVTQGWNPAVSRRMTQWLYSVGIPKLTGSGYSFTFTLKDCPKSAEDWGKLVKRLNMRFNRMGVVRYHWLTEWQSRGVPHLHGCVYFDFEVSHRQIIDCWLECSAKYQPLAKSQNVKPIYDDVGWFKYLSKHAVRGVLHYQRNSDNIPKEWKGHTGRMWGKGGDWGSQQPIKLELDDKSYYRFRRIVRSWRKAKARSEYQAVFDELMRTGSIDTYHYVQSRKNIIRARQLLKSHDVKVSHIRGVNEFFDIDESIRLVSYLKSLDYAQIEHL